MDRGSSNVYLRALRAWWWVVLAVPTVAVLVGVFLTNREPKVYRAAATAAVMPSPDISDPSDVMRGLETLERRTVIATFASFAETREALDSAAANLQLEHSELSGYRVHASVLPSTNIVRIDVRGGDGELVSVLANELVEVVASQARRMYRIFEMESLEEARPARGPFHPDPTRNAVIAGILGLFTGLLLTLLLEAVRSYRLRHPQFSPDSGWSDVLSMEETESASGTGTSR